MPTNDVFSPRDLDPLTLGARVAMRSLPPLNALRAFESAARHESFARAAVELSVTPSAISHQVRQLEDVLGVALFHRGTRTVHLTDAGRELLPGLGEAFERLHDAVARVRVDDRERVLRISVAPAFASGWLVPRLADFQVVHPDIEVRLDTSLALLDLVSGGVDVAIRYTADPSDDALTSHHLFDDESVPVCAPSLAGVPRVLADLARAPLLHSSGGCNDWASWLAAAGVEGVDVRAGPVFATDMLALEAAVHGLGVALAHRRLAERRIGDGVLVAPLGVGVLARHAYHLVYASARGGSGRVSAFRDWLLAAAAAGSAEPGAGEPR